MTCPANPDGTAHRYRLPPQGTPGPGVCVYCGAEKSFAPTNDSPWPQVSTRLGNARSNAAKAAKRGQQQ